MTMNRPYFTLNNTYAAPLNKPYNGAPRMPFRDGGSPVVNSTIPSSNFQGLQNFSNCTNSATSNSIFPRGCDNNYNSTQFPNVPSTAASHIYSVNEFNTKPVSSNQIYNGGFSSQQSSANNTFLPNSDTSASHNLHLRHPVSSIKFLPPHNFYFSNSQHRGTHPVEATGHSHPVNDIHHSQMNVVDANSSNQQKNFSNQSFPFQAQSSSFQNNLPVIPNYPGCINKNQTQIISTQNTVENFPLNVGITESSNNLSGFNASTNNSVPVQGGINNSAALSSTSHIHSRLPFAINIPPPVIRSNVSMLLPQPIPVADNVFSMPFSNNMSVDTTCEKESKLMGFLQKFVVKEKIKSSSITKMLRTIAAVTAVTCGPIGAPHSPNLGSKRVQCLRDLPHPKDVHIPEFRSALKAGFLISKELFNRKRTLKSLLQSDENSWNSEMQKIFNLQNQLSELCSLINAPCHLDYIIKKLKIIKNKRARKKKTKLNNLAEKMKKEHDREKLNQEIDKRLDDIKEKNIKLKREAEMKKEADFILLEVRRKIHEANRTIDKLKVFEKLRQARKDNAIKKGLHILPEHNEHFERKVSSLKETMLKQLVDYEAEENALKVMLETEQEDQLEKEAQWRLKKDKMLLQKKQNHIIECLFGNSDNPLPTDPLYLFHKYHTAADSSIENLVQIRRHWDAYLADDGEAIPQQWIVPVTASSSWEQWLINTSAVSKN